MFQVIVEERFDIVGDQDGILGSELLGPELQINRLLDRKKKQETKESYFGLVDYCPNQSRSPVPNRHRAEHCSVPAQESGIVASRN